MSTNNPYQPTSIVIEPVESDVPNPPLRYRFVAGSSSAIGTVFMVSGALAVFGTLLMYVLSPTTAGPGSINLLIASTLVMLAGAGLIYAGILWFNLRSRPAIGWTIISMAVFALPLVLG